MALLQQFFDGNPGVKFVRFTTMDFSSIPRVMVVPKNAALDVAKRGFLPGFASSVVSCATSATSLVWENIEPGHDELIPDWSSLKICTYYPAHATVMTFCRQPQEGKPRGGFAADPRSILIRQIEMAREHDVFFLVGLEIEFLLSEPSNKFIGSPASAVGLATPALRSKFTPILDDMVAAIEDAGIKVTKYHPEDGILGFFELVLAPLPPVEAADAMFFCHEAIKTIAQKHDLLATVYPTPYEKGMAIGGHINLSINEISTSKTMADKKTRDQANQPAEGDSVKSEISDRFLSGVLRHFRAIAAFSMPLYDSSKRSSRLRSWVYVLDSFPVP